MPQERSDNRSNFLLKNLLRGFIYFLLLILAFLFVKHNLDTDYLEQLAPFFDEPLIMYGIYTASELLFDLIPPEVFMMWSLRFEDPGEYALSIAILSVLSYWAAFVGFYVGKHLHGSSVYRFARNKLLPRYDHYVEKYGAFFVIVAAVTPFPYSAISMMVGSADYPTKRYLLYSLTRFLRFAVYSWMIWESNQL